MKMGNSPHMKVSEISSFCRGRIAEAVQTSPPPRSISPLSFYKVIKAVHALGRSNRNLKCFPFQEKISRGDAICYLGCKDLPGGRTVPHTMKHCWERIVRLDEELHHFILGYVDSGGILVNARLRIGTSLGQVLERYGHRFGCSTSAGDLARAFSCKDQCNHS